MLQIKTILEIKDAGKQMISTLSGWLFCTLILGLVFATGCLFEPREAEAPGVGASWIAPDAPNKVLTNIKASLEGGSGGNYEKSIGSDFVFVPHPLDPQQFPPGHLDNWNKAVEVEAILKLLGQASKIEVTFSPMTPISTQGDISRYEDTYTIEVTEIADPTEKVSYKGKALLDFKRGSRGYELIRWEDIESVSGFPTSGYLRGILK